MPITKSRIVPNVSQPNSESVNNEVVKKDKKHKKHKKDKKSKKSKQSSSPASTTATTERIPPVSIGPPILELPDSLSSNSMSLFGTTNDSMKDPHGLSNNNAFTNSIGATLPSTSINVTNAKSNASSSSLWTPTASTIKSNTVSTDDLTFTGRFTKIDDNIINIDSSSGSNSPKYRSKTPIQTTAVSRSSSPSRINLLPIRGGMASAIGSEYGSRVATDEENSSTQHISLIQQTESSRASPFGESLVQVCAILNEYFFY